ncbi:MAG: DUF4097 family beta strand repeat protein [Acidobacteriota bacterium]|jgi:DUF4097 and DUF4098 domain-containing protein YvlB
MKRSFRLAAAGLLMATTLLAAERREVIQQAFRADPGRLVLIDAGPLDLFVRAADVPEIRVNAELAAGALKEAQALAWIDAHRPQIEDGAEAFRLTVPEARRFGLLRGVVASRARLEVVLPFRVLPDLATSSGNLRVEGEFPDTRPLRLRTASGDVFFAGWAPRVELRSTSGSLEVRASRPLEELLARSASGNVTLAGGARLARCDNGSGSVRLNALAGPAGVATTSGNVALQFDSLAAGDEVRVTTSSGRVTLTLPPGAEPGGTLASSRGEIRSSYGGEASPEGGRFVLFGRKPLLTITTTSGRIDLS